VIYKATMAEFNVISQSRNGFQLQADFRKFPVTFVNGLRRILLHGVPTVVIRDVQILSNTTQMPHEMLKHRMELLPVNVKPDETTLIRDANVELRILPHPTDDRLITTDDFVVESGRNHILMKDRDLDTPILFLKVRKQESVHIRGRLSIDTEVASQVCTATMSYQIDEGLAKQKREEYIATGEDVRVFDNFYRQRYYSQNELGRPDWILLAIESVGVMQSKDILKLALNILKNQVIKWIDEGMNAIGRESEANVYRITLESGGHTIGSLIQEVMYANQEVSFVSYDIPHPLRPTLVIRFCTTSRPEEVLKTAKTTISEYCDIVEKGV
jgi:DNA-directed RNA polymerase alpha subunit